MDESADDPGVDPSEHDRAVARGESMYEDPETGFWVMTAASLAERGYCCGNGCRHCPYPLERRTSHSDG